MLDAAGPFNAYLDLPSQPLDSNVDDSSDALLDNLGYTRTPSPEYPVSLTRAVTFPSSISSFCVGSSDPALKTRVPGHSANCLTRTLSSDPHLLLAASPSASSIPNRQVFDGDNAVVPSITTNQVNKISSDNKSVSNINIGNVSEQATAVPQDVVSANNINEKKKFTRNYNNTGDILHENSIYGTQNIDNIRGSGGSSTESNGLSNGHRESSNAGNMFHHQSNEASTTYNTNTTPIHNGGGGNALATPPPAIDGAESLDLSSAPDTQTGITSRFRELFRGGSQ